MLQEKIEMLQESIEMLQEIAVNVVVESSVLSKRGFK
jgi:hypothetical protein